MYILRGESGSIGEVTSRQMSTQYEGKFSWELKQFCKRTEYRRGGEIPVSKRPQTEDGGCLWAEWEAALVPLGHGHGGPICAGQEADAGDTRVKMT